MNTDAADGADAREAMNLDRRAMIQMGAGAIIAGSLVSADDAVRLAKVVRARLGAGAPPLFFTSAELALVEELTDLIIPADEHSPGARAAEVAAYIDARLAESIDAERRQLWRSGLALTDRMSLEMHGKALLEATAEQRNAVLTRMARNEGKPETPEEKFFADLKTQTARAYYTSRIGIHSEMEYKGNTVLDQFVGYDAT